jgi:hypothetical protein
MQARTIAVRTVAELMQIWRSLRDHLSRDLSAMARLMNDPEGALLAEGYRVDGAAREALLAAIPR